MGGQVLPLVQPRATVEAQGQIKATPRQVLPLGGMVEGDMAQVMVVAMKGVMDMGHQCHHGNKVIAIEETGFLEIKVPQCKWVICPRNYILSKIYTNTKCLSIEVVYSKTRLVWTQI